MNDDSSDARNNTALAIPRAVRQTTHRHVHQPTRGPLLVLGEEFLQQGSVDRSGHSAFTRTPSRANCTPSSRDIDNTPPLEAQYEVLREVAAPITATNEAVLMIEPEPCSSM